MSDTATVRPLQSHIRVRWQDIMGAANAIVCARCALNHWRMGDDVVGGVDADIAGGCAWHATGRPAQVVAV